jgi:photosystem II stability/assembly factor-like uncharacterized protein
MRSSTHIALGLFATLLLTTQLLGQWQMVPLPTGTGRYDDIDFCDPLNGWAVNGAGTIHRTTDGGNTWQLQLSVPDYFRSVMAITPMKAFAGTLDQRFWRTDDGGATWTDISAQLVQAVPGICGLTAPTPQTIIGCGIWSNPAYIVRSDDGGDSWTHQAMAPYASALVDVHFLTPENGLACGVTPNPANGGVILGTTDGGETWTERYRTNQPGEYVWKLHSIDGQRWFASIQGSPAVGTTRYLRSDDGGLTWTEGLVWNSYHYIQMIGSLTNDLVYTGGNNSLFMSTDGGDTWGPIFVGSGYNRFLRIDDETGFIAGNQVFRRGNPTLAVERPDLPVAHVLRCSPNPTDGLLRVEVDVVRGTHLKVYVMGADGRILRHVHDGRTAAGPRSWTVDLGDLPAQRLFVILDSNEGQVHQQVVLSGR